jgi:hypothetical protein
MRQKLAAPPVGSTETTKLMTTQAMDFAADIEEIVRDREPWNPPTWG